MLPIFEQEIEHKQGRGREKGRHRIEAGSRLWAVSTEPNMGLEPTNCEIMIWAKVRCLTDWATQAPLKTTHFKFCPGKQFQVSELCWMPWKNNTPCGNPTEPAKITHETRINLEEYFNIRLLLRTMLKSREISLISINECLLGLSCGWNNEDVKALNVQKPNNASECSLDS